MQYRYGTGEACDFCLTIAEDGPAVGAGELLEPGAVATLLALAPSVVLGSSSMTSGSCFRNYYA